MFVTFWVWFRCQICLFFICFLRLLSVAAGNWQRLQINWKPPWLEWICLVRCIWLTAWKSHSRHGYLAFSCTFLLCFHKPIRWAYTLLHGPHLNRSHRSVCGWTDGPGRGIFTVAIFITGSFWLLMTTWFTIQFSSKSTFEFVNQSCPKLFSAEIFLVKSSFFSTRSLACVLFLVFSLQEIEKKFRIKRLSGSEF